MSGAIRVTIVSAQGSTPRDAGTAMLVWPDRIEGTIGGGALEWAAMHRARQMIADGKTVAEEKMPLGPGLGQCCGGSVAIRFEAADTFAETAGKPLWIWGAGHVGRALVDVLAPLPDISITWVDTAPDRFPAQVPDGVTMVPAAAPDVLVPRAPADARHLILTYSHDLDLALCHALLTHDFETCGLIGSETKWARFRKRLTEMGHAAAQIDRICCPIGQKSLGKHPHAIAVGVAATLLEADARTKAQESGTG